MYILNVATAIKKMSVNEIRDFIIKTIIKEFNLLSKTALFNEMLAKIRFAVTCKQSNRKIT